MTHRADQIIDAIASYVKAYSPSTVEVHTHRRLSLSCDEELPAISIDFGEDTPFAGDGSSMLDGTIESLLTVNVTAVASDVEERALRKKLLEMRTHVHRAIKTVRKLELEFVTGTLYGGALAPEVDVSGDAIIGELTSQWGVIYEMDEDNPE